MTPVAIPGKGMYSVEMRYFIAAFLAMAFLTACETSKEDQDFYYSGWLHPERDAEKRLQQR